MAEWEHHINGLKEPLEVYDGVNLIETRDAVVAVLKDQIIWAENPPEDPVGEAYWYIVDEMADATSESEFDACLGALYDWGDDNRIWIGAAI